MEKRVINARDPTSKVQEILGLSNQEYDTMKVSITMTDPDNALLNLPELETCPTIKFRAMCESKPAVVRSKPYMV